MPNIGDCRLGSACRIDLESVDSLTKNIQHTDCSDVLQNCVDSVKCNGIINDTSEQCELKVNGKMDLVFGM